MAATTAGKAFSALGAVFQPRINPRYTQLLCPLVQVREYAARKGTREKRDKLKKKKKVAVQKIGWIQPNLRVKKSEILSLNLLKRDDSAKKTTTDDVWLQKYHQLKIFSFEEALQCHRETHHPTSYNLPNAFVNAFIELDMTGVTDQKTVEPFSRTVDIPRPFDHGEHRTVVAFSKTPEILELADKAGAVLTGSTELIAKIQSGEIAVDDFHSFVAHPDIITELSVIRGLLKRKYPNPRAGTLGLHLPAMIRKILHGIKYSAISHERQIKFATITVPIGRLPMDHKDLEENFKAVIQDVNKMKPKRDGPFIWRTCLTCAASPEKLKINFEQYLEKSKKPDDESDDSDDEDEASIRV
ncbi:39S ribosomal protein L1, mitochondrial [Fopius arisanus]|uniref:39S ribosomal protein L1, mitochondrial n=1 Tax=Fopius arisanus TaxID=64838 RepID=A0A9R1U0V2_9HYME|nr:PREDICTED: 39S ribosomal protein L1, mitochondrial [Fopius arisanus]